MDLTCRWCGEAFTSAHRPGPLPRYCRASHRQRAYEARRRARESILVREREAGPPVRLGRFDVSIRVLGPVEAITGEGERISLGPKLQGLLAVLAVRPRQTVSVERLIDLLWPNVDDERARHRLHTAVSKLRRLLAPGAPERGRRLIRGSRAGLVLDVEDEQLDWLRFRRLVDAGERALKRGEAGLATSYLSAALSLWSGEEPLAGVEVASEDVGFISGQIVARERAQRALLEARLIAGEYNEVIPELEAMTAADPADCEALHQLALTYYWSGRPDLALAVCGRYLKDAAEKAERSITELRTAILHREPEIAKPALQREVGLRRGRREPSGRSASLSCRWGVFTASQSGPLPAELFWVVEAHGGENIETTELSVEASFEGVRAALEGAIAVQRALGRPPLARVGIDVHPTERLREAFEAASRTRARGLAAAAGEGQMLITDSDGGALVEPSLPPGSRLRPLGKHRLNVLTPPTLVFQLLAPDLPDLDARPRWSQHGPVHNLAEQPFRLIGRARELGDITEIFTEHTLVTLVGAPGSGKTRLAAEVATGLSSGYTDGVWFIGLQAVHQPDLVAPAVAEAMRMPGPGPMHPEDALVHHLTDRQVLLVVDNCEHLLSASRRLVDRLLSSCPGVSVLATSRQALGSHTEFVVSLAPLEPPPAGSADRLMENAAVQLFYDRLGAGRSPVEPRPPVEVEAVAQICRAVDGIPLGLVLAAARAREVGSVVLADALNGRLGEGIGLGLLSPRESAETTLDDTLEWSFLLLGEEEQRLLAGLSVFKAGFELEDVAAVCSETGSRAEILTALDRLAAASLIEIQGLAGRTERFRLHQPIREYAASKLAACSDRRASLQRRHAHHFLALIEAAEPHLHGRQEQEVLDRVETILPDLYAATRWAIDEGEAQVALRLVGAMWVFWLVRGRIREGREFLEAALAADRSISAERAKALVACSQMAWFGGDFHRVNELCRETLAIAEATDDQFSWAWGPLGIAAVKMFGPEDDGVPNRIEELVPAFRTRGVEWDTGQAIQTLGGAAWHRGQYERAEQALAESSALYRSLGHRTLMASELAHGLVIALRGRLEEGAAEVEQSIAAAYEAGDLIDLAYALGHRAAIARYAGHHDLARHHYRDALRLAVDMGQVWLVQWAIAGLASSEYFGADVSVQRLAASVQLLARAVVLARESGIVLAPRERQYHAEDLDHLRCRLGEQAYRAAFARGERLSLDEAVEIALRLE